MGFFSRKIKNLPHIKYPVIAITSDSRFNFPYQEGDQFFVTDDLQELIYEVFDPSTKRIGKVLKQNFTTLVKSTVQPFFGTCLYDFEGMEEDELSLKENEEFIILSQVDEEWFYGRAITRVATGIVPVSYVEIRDAKSGKLVSKDDLVLPTMAEYNLRTATYKDKSIPLHRHSSIKVKRVNSVFSELKNPASEGNLFKKSVGETTSDYSDASSIEFSSNENTDLGAIDSLQVSGSILNKDLKTEFTLFCSRNTVMYTLYRSQQDFVHLDSQLSLYFSYKLPTLPPPITLWTRSKTDDRVVELDSYLKSILALPSDISQSNQLKLFLMPRRFDRQGAFYKDPSDVETKLFELKRRSSF